MRCKQRAIESFCFNDGECDRTTVYSSMWLTIYCLQNHVQYLTLTIIARKPKAAESIFHVGNEIMITKLVQTSLFVFLDKPYNFTLKVKTMYSVIFLIYYFQDFSMEETKFHELESATILHPLFITSFEIFAPSPPWRNDANT